VIYHIIIIQKEILETYQRGTNLVVGGVGVEAGSKSYVPSATLIYLVGVTFSPVINQDTSLQGCHGSKTAKYQYDGDEEDAAATTASCSH
jgi:hypothetical protein